MAEKRGEIHFSEAALVFAEGMLNEKEWGVLRAGGPKAKKLVAEKFLKNRESLRELGGVVESEEIRRQKISVIRFDAFLGWCLSERFPGAVKHLCC